MPTCTNAGAGCPVPGTPAYWQASREGFALLHGLRRAIREALAVPTYVASAGDEDGGSQEPEWNTEPWDRAMEVLDAARAHPYARRIMAAHGITDTDLDDRPLEWIAERLPLQPP